MANVYFVKMKDPNQVENCEFIDPTPDNFPALQQGDLCFVRFEGESTPSALKRLWDFERFVDNEDGSMTAKFTPHWVDADGKEIFFNTLQLKAQFASLNFFEFSKTMANFIHRPTKAKSFFPLIVVKQAEFDTAIRSVGDFNNYVDDANNYRKVEVVTSFASHSENIQLKKDASGVYELHRDNFLDTTTIVNLFEGNNPNECAARKLNTDRFWLGTDKGKMYQYLKNGDGVYNLVGFYDLFCSQVPLATERTSTTPHTPPDFSGTDNAETTSRDITADSVATADADTHYDYDSPSIELGGENLIIYGTPGCGKSHELASRLAKDFPEDNRIRVTFHQDYTYTDFVGQILPMVSDDDKVRYEFIPGPFTLALAKAIECKGEKVALVIEEINRGNAASIFGDLFQLLDRDTNGTSVYELTNVQIAQYLQRRFSTYTLDYIKIPANLSIFATMNTGDQNVFTLDTAFKRRWNFEKLSNKFNKRDAHSGRCIPGMSNVTWENFVTAINEHMIKEGAFDSEDKQLGKYFITYTQLVGLGENDDVKTRKFAYKVLEYLWNDVAKFDRERWFNISKYKTLDSVIEAWTTGKGKDVFNNDIIFAITLPTAVTTAATSSTTASDSTEDAGGEE